MSRKKLIKEKIADKKEDIALLTQELSWWERAKAWFSNSETILINRSEVFFGFMIASLASLDWSPLIPILGSDTGFSWGQVKGIGAYLIVRGVVGELARRRGATDL